jgi:N-methylhydantoinase A
VAASVYDRNQLLPGHRIQGPAIVGQSDTTVLIPPRWSARVDGYRNLLAQREQ